MDESYFNLEIKEISQLIQSKKLSILTLTKDSLDRVYKLQKNYKCFTEIYEERAIVQAQKLEALLLRGIYLSPLHGVPLAFKDLIDIQGFRTTAGMPEVQMPIATQTATVLERLEQSGCVTLGKLQLTEGALTFHHPNITPPVNPWGAQLWSGASSSGSGVAVAARMCFGALGSDTGGSIRFPSAANSITGLKPTWSRVSRFGVFPLAPLLDHIGPMAKSAYDCGIILNGLGGHDPRDDTSIKINFPDVLNQQFDHLDGVSIAVDENWIQEDISHEVYHAVVESINVLKNLGAQIEYCKFPSTAEITKDWLACCASECASVHEELFRENRNSYGPVLSSFIEYGGSITASELQKIFLRRKAYQNLVNQFFSKYDCLVIPTLTIPSPTQSRFEALAANESQLIDLIKFTAPFDMSGHPTITLPCGFSRYENSPLSFQIAAGEFKENTLIRAGSAYQKYTNWHKKFPEDLELYTNN